VTEVPFSFFFARINPRIHSFWEIFLSIRGLESFCLPAFLLTHYVWNNTLST